MDFDFNLLPILIALYEERSVTRAASALNMSQPSVSAALRKLRLAFKDQLFVKTSRGVEPTPRAESLAIAARQALALVEGKMLSEQSFDPGKEEGSFTFALSGAGETFLLPVIMEHLRKLAPRCQVHSVWPSTSEIAQGLISGEIDIAIGSFTELQQSNFFRQRLYTLDMACMVRADHPVAHKDLTMKQYLTLEHITVRSAGRSRQMADQILSRTAPSRKIALTTTHSLSLPYIVEKTDLVATIGRVLAVHFLENGAKIKILKAPPEIPAIAVNQVWHRKFNEDPRNIWLRHLVKGLFPHYIRHLFE
jgi:DNA-binding transcriptional LysR family regulator